jgi:hypothetical protein
MNFRVLGFFNVEEFTLALEIFQAFVVLVGWIHISNLKW